MDIARFDRLARALGALRTRRAAAGFLGGLITASLLPAGVTAAKPKQQRNNARKSERKKCKNGAKKCGGKCRNIQRDARHCGACGNRCRGTEACRDGVCVDVNCPPEQCCADNQTCSGTGRCREGVCQPRPNCLSAGEYLPLFGATPPCCSDDADCSTDQQGGMTCICEPSAPLEPCLKHSDCRYNNCVGYQCGGCPAGTVLCNGECITTFDSDAHCGACGHACAPSEYCHNQTCQPRYVEDGFIAAPDVYDISVNNTGTILATRYRHHCVLQYSQAGTLEYTYGICGLDQGGDENNRLQFPGTAIASANRVFIADTFNNRVQIFRRGGGRLASLAAGPGTGNNKVYFPEGLALDADRNISIADTGNNRIQMFNRNDDYVRTIGTGAQGSGFSEFDRPVRVAYDRAGNVYVVDYGNNRIQKFRKRTGSYLQTYGQSGSGTAVFSYPNTIAVTSTGDLFVKDNGRVQQVSASGDVIRVFAAPELPEVMSVAVDAEDNLYIADSTRGGIVRFKLNAPTSS